jgi:putative ABC transport system permease protein
MFSSYLKIAWRNIRGRKIYTFINVIGLALGISACVVIYLITTFEFSYDRFQPDKDRIYRIVGEIQNSSGEKQFENCILAPVAGFQDRIPGFESEAGFHNCNGRISIPDGSKAGKKFDNKLNGTNETTAIITWPDYFSVFSYQWLAGSPQVLKDPFKVVLTEKRAIKYFGNIPYSQMLGKTVVYGDSLSVHVAGIVKDWDHHTDFGYTDFISISTAAHSYLRNQIPTQDWASLQPHNGMAWVKLTKGAGAGQINDRFAAFIKEQVKMPPGVKMAMWLQPLEDIHFSKEYHRGDDGDLFRKPYLPTLYALMGVALFILILATVNFINLSTAQSIQRAKEIGVRKVMGSSRKNIMFQFLTETFVLALLSAIVAVLSVKPILYLFRNYVPDGVAFDPFNLLTLSFLGGVTLVTTLLAGFYPARVLAGYHPVLNLKGAAFQKGKERLNLRKGLILFQFTISLLFIVGALVIGKQIKFMSQADKGFSSNAVIVVNHWRDRDGKLRVFAGQISHIPGVRQAIIEGNAPMGFGHGGQFFNYRDGDRVDREVSFEEGTEEFIPFYKMKLTAGRNIAHSDSLNELVINETYSRILGFHDPRAALGKFLYTNDKPYPIVGVVADFHEDDFRTAILPVVIARDPQRDWSVAIKLEPGVKKPSDVQAVLSAMGQQWKKIYPDDPFDYHFLNDNIAWLMGQEDKTAWLVNTAMCITLFISCIGLFGLGMFTAQRRTREIGIRKVLGASVTNIAAMLGKEYILLIVISLVIASPIAWYFMNQWLAGFAYRIPVGGWVFLWAGLAAIVVSLITVSYQAIRAALANPVNSLRAE